MTELKPFLSDNAAPMHPAIWEAMRAADAAVAEADILPAAAPEKPLAVLDDVQLDGTRRHVPIGARLRASLHIS